MTMLARGVWRAPWLGPNGETVLIAVRRDGRQAVEPFTVPFDADPLAAAEWLEGNLERADARPQLELVR
jgi:hypothetical protein